MEAIAAKMGQEKDSIGGGRTSAVVAPNWLERMRRQMRFDTDRVLAAVNQQEKRVAEVCGAESKTRWTETAEKEEKATTTEASTIATTTHHQSIHTIETTTETPTAIREKQQAAIVAYNKVSEEERDLMRSCEDLMLSGKFQSGVYLVDVDNDDDKDEANAKERSFRQRFCEQESSGGGWTVRGQTRHVVASLSLLYCLLAVIANPLYL